MALRKITVNGQTIKVIKSRCKEPSHRDSSGCYHPDERIIRINADQWASRPATVLLHEVLHALCFERDEEGKSLAEKLKKACPTLRDPGEIEEIFVEHIDDLLSSALFYNPWLIDVFK